MYVKEFGVDNVIILLLYVDDMLIVGQYVNMIHKLKVELFKTFDMKDFGSIRTYIVIWEPCWVM